MLHTKLYRYTSNGEGIFSAGKRLLPEELVEEAWGNRQWLPKPQLPEGDYRFFLTEKGKETYENTLLRTHKKYLDEIHCESYDLEDESGVVYRDEWQVVLSATTTSATLRPSMQI